MMQTDKTTIDGVNTSENGEVRLKCPLKGVTSPVLAFWNVDMPLDVGKYLGEKCISVRDGSRKSSIEYIGGYCDGPGCAWYDGRKGQCAVISIARGCNK